MRDQGARRLLLVLAAMAAAVPILPAILGRTVVDSPFVLDIGNQWIGFAAFVRDCYLAGHFPLWDPHDLCGTPFLAFAHTGSLYLPAVAAHLALPGYTAAAAIDIFVHLFIAGTGVFLLLRRDDRSPYAAFAGGIIYAFSGFVFANINFPPSLHTAAWLPVWYAGAFGLLDRPRRRDAALAVAGLAAMIYGGDLEMVVFGGLGLVFWAGMRWRDRSIDWRKLAALAATVATGLLLALPQALPAIELQARSIRAGGVFTPEISPLFLLAASLIMFLPMPMPAGLFPPNHGLDPWYLGILPLVLNALALRSPAARRPLWALPAAAVYFLLFYSPPMSRLFSLVPVLGGLMVPFRLQPVLWLFLVLAVARALDEWAEGETEDPAERFLPGGRRGGLALMVFAAVTVASLFLFKQAIAPRAVFALVLFLTGLRAWRPKYRLIGVLVQSRYRFALLLIGADLYALALACVPMTLPASLEPDPRAARFIAGTTGRERYLVYSIRGIIDPGLPYHLGPRLGADTIDSFTRVPPRNAALRLADLYPTLLRFEHGRLWRYDQMAVRDPLKLDRRRLGLLNDLNVKWLLGRSPWPYEREAGAAIAPVFATPPGHPDPFYVYRNDAALPRAFIRCDGSVTPVAADHRRPDELTLDPVPADGGIISISESWYPGWRASLTRVPFSVSEIRIEVDEFGLRQVRPEAAGRVTMLFQPRSFRIGLWSGLASILSAVVFVARRKIAAPAPPA